MLNFNYKALLHILTSLEPGGILVMTSGTHRQGSAVMLISITSGSYGRMFHHFTVTTPLKFSLTIYEEKMSKGTSN